MFEISVLASGSSGNCFYIGTEKAEILIDAGISCRQICRRLEKIGKSIQNIQGIFITHEHTDHILGIDVLTRRYNIPVYLNKGTLDHCSVPITNAQIIKTDKAVNFRGLHLLPFSKSHDAHDPVSYLIINEGKRVSVITDVGYCCDNVKHSLQECDVVILEANHDIEMLHNGPYPPYLKKRIAGAKGHLSNHDAAMAVLEHASKNLRYALLSHLSLYNNTPECALQTFTSIIKQRNDLKHLKTRLSYRDEPTELIRLGT